MDELTPHELLLDIEKKDRRFRVAQSVFMALIVCVLGAIFFLQYSQIQTLQDQSADRAKNTQKILQNQANDLKSQQKQIATTNAYIQCIARFFATTDRSDQALVTLDNCDIQDNGVNVPGVDQTPTASSGSTTPSSTQTAPQSSPKATPATPPAKTAPTVKPKLPVSCKIDFLFVHLLCR